MRPIGDYVYNIGDRIITDKSDYTITGRYIGKNSQGVSIKMYNFHCNKCGYDGVKRENHINKKGCPCCANRIIVPGINDIATKAPWMIQFFENPEDTKKVHPGSDKTFFPVCPCCGNVSKTPRKIRSIFIDGGFKCDYCNPGKSYGERFIISLLDYLGVKYYNECSRKILKWAEKKRYDFYLPDYSMIIEVHGNQHYNRESFRDGASLEEIKKNDQYKYNLAKKNNIQNYIIIDCRKSEFDWILNSIKESQLLNIIGFQYDNIDWNCIQEEAVCPRYLDIAKYFSQHFDGKNTHIITEMSEKYHLSQNIIIKSLRMGTQLGICYYDAIEMKKQSQLNYQLINSIPIALIDENMDLIIECKSIVELIKMLHENYNVNIARNTINKYAKNGKLYKGYYFKYIDKDKEVDL